jgi:hypothetical protein
MWSVVCRDLFYYIVIQFINSKNEIFIFNIAQNIKYRHHNIVFRLNSNDIDKHFYIISDFPVENWKDFSIRKSSRVTRQTKKKQVNFLSFVKHRVQQHNRMNLCQHFLSSTATSEHNTTVN